MNKEVLEFVVEKTKELMAAPSCSQEAKDAAQAWLDAVGTDRQEEETKKYIAELEEDIVTVDGLIAFAESEAGLKCLELMQVMWLNMQKRSKQPVQNTVIARPALQ